MVMRWSKRLLRIMGMRPFRRAFHMLCFGVPLTSFQRSKYLRKFSRTNLQYQGTLWAFHGNFSFTTLSPWGWPRLSPDIGSDQAWCQLLRFNSLFPFLPSECQAKHGQTPKGFPVCTRHGFAVPLSVLPRDLPLKRSSSFLHGDPT